MEVVSTMHVISFWQVDTKQEGRECDSDRYKEGCTDLASFNSLSLVLQACLLSPLHLLLLFLVSLQIEFLVPGLVLGAYSISCSPRNAFQGILAWTQCLWSCQNTLLHMNTEIWKSLWLLYFLPIEHGLIRGCHSHRLNSPLTLQVDLVAQHQDGWTVWPITAVL